MAPYWLAPLTSDNPVTIGTQRLYCDTPAFETFREKVQSAAQNQRFLLAFKADLLLDDEDGDGTACGISDNGLIDFNVHQPICFGVSGMPPLSHCAEAFLHRLPVPREWSAWLAEQTAPWNEQELQWLQHLQEWTNHGWTIVLLKEG
jgi:hypothetical protein